ncbi:GNAT family N-acetyltransferase [Streptomyces sp. SYSU K217416]
MTWTFTDDLAEYLAVAGATVAARPVRHTLLLTVAAALERRGPHAYGEAVPLFGWWRGPDGAVAGAVVWTPPHPVLVGAVPPESLAPLVTALRAQGAPGFNAERTTAEGLAAAWREHTGETLTTAMEQRLYRLGRLTPPDPAPAGRARVAAAADRELLVDWLRAFARDTGQSPATAESAVEDRLGYGGLTLWEADGRPVSLAGAAPTAGGTVRIASVYTPAEHRGHGYAAAVTAEVSRTARAAGADEVLLFTDLANPTSNGVYRRIGYRPVADWLTLT